MEGNDLISIAIRSDSATITSGTQLVRRLGDIPQGARIMKIQVSVENTCIMNLKNIMGLELFRRDAAETILGQIEKAIVEGISFGGDFVVDFFEYYKMFPKLLETDFGKVRGTMEMTFDQSTGNDVDMAMVIEYGLEA